MNPKFRTPLTVIAALGGVILLILIVSLVKTGVFSSKNEPPPLVISSATVRANENLPQFLKQRFSLSNADINGVQKALAPAFKGRPFMEKDYYEVGKSTDGLFRKLTFMPSQTHYYEVVLSTQNQYVFSEIQKPTIWVEKRIKVEVKESIYRDLLKQGYDETFVANIVSYFADNIFAWKIDFFTEQRTGDRIDIVLEQEHIVEGMKPLNRSGNIRILTATYFGKGTRQKQNYAYRYLLPGTTQPDYYDEDGNALRKAFKRAPFKVGDSFHVSSRFSEHRFHPILKVYRPHHGTDFAAAYGTRVYTIGNGKVIYAGWKEGFGNCVEVRHSSKYVSRYGHLSSIAVKVGESVLQSAFVGRVGSTGLSTGPHLHFEMLVDGRPTDFGRMSFPPASAVDKKYMDDFKRVRDGLIAKMNEPEKKEEEGKGKKG